MGKRPCASAKRQTQRRDRNRRATLEDKHDQMLRRIARLETRRFGSNDEFVMAPHYFLFIAVIRRSCK